MLSCEPPAGVRFPVDGNATSCNGVGGGGCQCPCPALLPQQDLGCRRAVGDGWLGRLSCHGHKCSFCPLPPQCPAKNLFPLAWGFHHPFIAPCSKCGRHPGGVGCRALPTCDFAGRFVLPGPVLYRDHPTPCPESLLGCPIPSDATLPWDSSSTGFP